MKGLKFFLLILFASFITLPVESQILINEVCTSNHLSLEDADGDSPDYIELINVSSTPINLSAYSLSDENAPYSLWHFPNIQLLPQEIIVVFASGKNRIIDELHTNFKLSSKGEELYLHYNGNISTVSIPFLHSDNSYGLTDDYQTYAYFNEPTPGEINNSIPYLGYSSKVVVSEQPGFYDHSISIHLYTSDINSSIYFTTDGNNPIDSGTLYSGSITLDSTATLAVMSKAEGYLPSKITTGTFFIHEDEYMPVVSITTPPYLLFDPDSGLYNAGPNASPNPPYYGANFWNNKHIPAHVEYFVDKKRMLSQDCELRMHGGKAARVQPQHALRLMAKKRLGSSHFEGNLIPSKPIFKYKKFVVRNGGGDFDRIHFTDGFIQNETLKGELNFYSKGSNPVVVYINGKYFGVQDIQEKIDQHFCRLNAGLDDSTWVDVLEDDTIALFGDFEEFDSMLHYFEKNNLKNEEAYLKADSLLDISGFTDYFITELFWNNLDWPANNVKYWKPDLPNAKWKYILFDLDVSLNSVGFINEYTDNLQRILRDYRHIKHVRLFIALLENPEYKRHFINRYADLVNTCYSAENLTRDFLQLANYVTPEMDHHFQRWGGSVSWWWEYWLTPRAIQFVENRSPIALNQVESQFTLDGQYNLHLDAWPFQSGKIHLNTIQPDSLPWDGTYFKNLMIDLQAIPAPGYVFKEWSCDHTLDSDIHSPSIQVSFADAVSLTAVFESVVPKASLLVYPNPNNGIFSVASYHEKPETGIISIHDGSGKLVYQTSIDFSSGLSSVPLRPVLDKGMYNISLSCPSSISNFRFIVFE